MGDTPQPTIEETLEHLAQGHDERLAALIETIQSHTNPILVADPPILESIRPFRKTALEDWLQQMEAKLNSLNSLDDQTKVEYIASRTSGQAFDLFHKNESQGLPKPWPPLSTASACLALVRQYLGILEGIETSIHGRREAIEEANAADEDSHENDNREGPLFKLTKLTFINGLCHVFMRATTIT